MAGIQRTVPCSKTVDLLKHYWTRHVTRQHLHFALSPTGIPAHHVFGYLSLWERTRVLQEELSIRYSHQVRKLVRLPYGMPNLRDTRAAINLHVDSFSRLVGFPQPTSDADVERFIALLSGLILDHNSLETELISGLQLIFEDPFVEASEVNSWMDSFFMSRIAIRTLITQHIAMVKGKPSIVRSVDVGTVLQDAIEQVAVEADLVYTNVPKIDFKPNCAEIITPYISAYLFYVLKEVLKNAVVAHAITDQEHEPILVSMSEGKDTVTIKIEDKGGGFDIGELSKMMYFGFSSDPVVLCEEFELSGVPIFSGFGYGLPMARLYTKYLGGRFRILPVEGVGADVYLYIPKMNIVVEHF